MIEKRQEIKEARQGFNEDETAVAKDHAKDTAPATAAASRDDDLNDLDEDEDLDYLNVVSSSKGTGSKKRKKAPK